MKKEYAIPNDVCLNQFLIILEAEKAIEDGYSIIFLGIEYTDMEKLIEAINKYCSVTDPRILKGIDRMRELIAHKYKS